MKHIMHTYQGQQHTAEQLAALAGCSAQAMRKRLRDMAPEMAVIMGESAKQKRYEHNGQWLTHRQLAALAGCSACAMKDRMRHGYTPAQAVAQGPSALAALYKARREKAAERKRTKAEARIAAKVPKAKPAREYDRLTADAPVICNVKPTVIPTGMDRRHTFTGQPGRWVDSSECRPWAAAVSR